MYILIIFILALLIICYFQHQNYNKLNKSYEEFVKNVEKLFDEKLN